MSISFFGLFKASLPLGIVVDNPRGKANGTFNGHAMIFDAAFEVFERSSGLDVGVESIKPWLDSIVASLSSHIDFLLDTQLLAANGAGIQAIAESSALDALGLVNAGLALGD
jgi:hypothetical protein